MSKLYTLFPPFLNHTFALLLKNSKTNENTLLESSTIHFWIRKLWRGVQVGLISRWGDCCCPRCFCWLNAISNKRVRKRQRQSHRKLHRRKLGLDRMVCIPFNHSKKPLKGDSLSIAVMHRERNWPFLKCQICTYTYFECTVWISMYILQM